MKTIEQYTDSELLEMDGEQRQSLIELQCAIDGVPMLPPYPQAPTKPDIEADKIVHTVTIGYSDVATFATKEAAQLVADTINGADQLYVDHNYFGSQKVECIKDETVALASVGEKKCLSPSLMASFTEVLNKYKKDNALYDDLMSAYKLATEAREASVGVVENAINTAYSCEYKRKDALQKYDHYLNLSDGDAEIALKFFNANYSDLREFLPTSITTPVDMPSDAALQDDK